MKQSTRRYIIIGLIVVVLAMGAALGVMEWRKRHGKSYFRTENYAAAGAIDNVGSLGDDQYELLAAPDMEVPAFHFADLVSGDQLDLVGTQKGDMGDEIRPEERLHRVQGSALMPRTSLAVTPYNVDVAAPQTHFYMANTPRVQLKSRFKDYNMSSFVRGDIPIKYHPNVPLISKTVQGRDDLRLDGLFTPHFVALYNKYTGKAYKNMPLHVAGAGQAAGYGGASGEVVMDHY